MKKAILTVAFMLLVTALTYAADFDAYTYWVTPGTKKTVAWTAGDALTEGYEIYVWQMEGSRRFLSGRILATNQIEITWRTPGHYIIYCRAFKGSETAREWSDWVNTLDPTVGEVNGQPRAWVLYVAPY